MKRGAGSRKGSAFEREVCRALSLWLTGGKNPDVFWRTAASGARATSWQKKGRRIAAHEGDIMAIASPGGDLTSLFLIECKARRDMDIDTFFTAKRPQGQIWKVWTRLVKDSTKAGKMPMLIFRNNSRQPLMMLDNVGYKLLFQTRPPKKGRVRLLIRFLGETRTILFADFLELAVLGNPWPRS